MPCYHPLHAFKGLSEDKQKIKICFKRSNSWRGEKIDLPCGQCIGCRLERARQWAVRCTHEASLYDKNCFITLTYNDENLPKEHSLILEHYQLFMKRLRKKYGSGIRFFHCGEYGEEFGRPHYHALLFNHDFEDKKYHSTHNGSRLYTSESLSTLWPFGFSIIGEVSFESAGYVARYALKKVTGKKSGEYYQQRKPEYCTMSRRPGIGKKWYEKYKGEVYPNDKIFLRGIQAKPPKFYDKQLEKENPSEMAIIKIQREKDAGKKYCTDVVRGKTIVESDSTDRRLNDKEVTKTAQMSLYLRHKGGNI